MSFTGTWTITLDAPTGEQTFTFEAVEENGELTGTVTNGRDTGPVQKGRVNGDEVRWDLPIKKPIPLTLGFKGSYDGDEVSGKTSLGFFGSAKFTGTRQG